MAVRPLSDLRADRASGEGAAALDALAVATSDLLAGGSLDEALAAVVRAAALAVGAELALARVAAHEGDALVTRAVHARSQVLAAELEGSKLAADELPAAERAYEPGRDASTPAPIRRAAGLAGAEVVHLFPVHEREAPLATLEFYRERGELTPGEQALGRLAAAHVGLAVELSESPALGRGSVDGIRASLDLAGEALAAGSDEQELAEHVVRVAADATGATRCLLWRIEAETPPAFLAAHGFDGALDDLNAAGETVETAIQRRGESTERDAAAAGPHQGEIVVPLGEPPAGALQLFFADPADAHVPESLSGLAARAAVALRRTRRAQLVALALRRSQTIVGVISQAIAHLSLPHTLQTAVDRISELTASSHVAIYLLEGERLTTAAARGLRGSHTALAERLLELALGPFRGRGYLFIADMRRDRRLAGLEDVLADAGVRRALVVPLLVHEEVIGALAVYKQRPRPYRPGEEGLLIALSSQLAVAVENARLHARAEERGTELERILESERKAAHQLQGLFEISHSFARSLSLDATLEAVAQAMVGLFGLDAAVIRLPDGRGDALESRAVAVAEPALQAAAVTILSRPQPLSDALPRRVLESREPVVLTGSDGEAEADPILEPFLKKGSTVAVLPLATPSEVIGTVTLVCLDPARPLDADTVATAMTVTAQAALAIDNARLSQQQKDFAETMQRSLLPSERPSIAGLELGHVYQSSARVDVGGDVYDFLSLDDGRLAVCLGDVAGKGIQAAADMAMAKFAFRALARNYPDPGEFLARVNDVVTEEIALGKFITMLYAVVDPRTGQLVCANAGHPPLRLVRPDGSVAALPSPGLALGVDSYQTYGEERLQLERGTSVVLYTDGVIEARRDGELYGEARLDAFLQEHAGLSAQALAQALLDDCAAFSGGDVSDDCAIVCLRLAP